MSVEYQKGDLVRVDTVPHENHPMPAIETWALVLGSIWLPFSTGRNPNGDEILHVSVDQHPAPDWWPHGTNFFVNAEDVKEHIPAAKVPDTRINQFMERPEQEPQEEFVAAFNSGATLEACTDDELLAELTKRLGFRRIRDAKVEQMCGVTSK